MNGDLPISKRRRRIFLVNSNTDLRLTDRLSEIAASRVGADFEIVARTPAFGGAYVGSRAEVAIAGHAIISTIAEAVQELGGEIDACVIACFGEPGLAAARELFDFPVVGVAEAAMLTICQTSTRFALLMRSPRWISMLSELALIYGLDRRCAGVFALDTTDGAESMADAVCRRTAEIIERTGADGLILGGGALVGLAQDVQDRLPIPVIDALTAAVLQARLLIDVGMRKPLLGPYSHPSSSPVTGVGEELRRMLSGD